MFKIGKKTYYGFFETLVGVFVIFYFFYLSTPMKMSFLNLNIHPFLIIVAIISIRYGNIMGLFSSFLSSIFYLYAYLDSGKDLYLFFTDLNNYKFPLMFIATSIVLGKFKENKDKEINALKKKNKFLENKYQKLKEINEKNSFIKEELKKRIISSDTSLYSLYEIVNKLDRLEIEQIYTELMGILIKFIKAKTVSFFVFDKGKNILRLKARYGGKSKLERSSNVHGYQCLKEAVLNEKFDKNKKYCRIGYPLLVSPIKYNKEIIGVIAVEEVEFEMLSEFTKNLFNLIIKCADKFLYFAIKEDKSLSNKYYKNTKILKYKYFKKRLKEENRRLEEYGMEFVLFKYRVENFNIKEINLILKNIVRNVDVISFNREKSILNILMPATPSEFAENIEKRILNKFDYRIDKIK